MISIKCELNDKSLYSLVDDAFVNYAGMNKIDTGTYEGIGNVVNTSYKAIKRLFKNKNIVNNFISFTRTVDGEEEDVIKFYNFLVTKGKI